MCLRCGKQLEDNDREFCHDCSVGNFFYERGVAAFSYSDSLKKSMYAFKYNNRREYAGFYAHCIAMQYGNVIRSWNADLLVPIPLHAAKLRKRGYNQAQVLAQALGKELGIPVDAKSLVRIRNTRPQKELDDKQRKNNIEKAFQITKKSIKYKKIILVDDIYTTGTTINECAAVLKNGGADKVFFITACIGKGF